MAKEKKPVKTIEEKIIAEVPRFAILSEEEQALIISIIEEENE